MLSQGAPNTLATRLFGHDVRRGSNMAAAPRLIQTQRVATNDTFASPGPSAPRVRLPQHHSRQAVAHLVDLVAAVLRLTGAELATAVVAPGLDGRVVELRAGVSTTGRDGDGRSAEAQLHLGQLVTHLVDLVAAVLRITEAELAT